MNSVYHISKNLQVLYRIFYKLMHTHFAFYKDMQKGDLPSEDRLI